MIYIVDTNFLLRFLLADDVEQSSIARSYFTNRNYTLVIDIAVLCEAVWVMKKRAKLKNEIIIKVLQSLATESHIHIDKTRFNHGLEFLKQGGDFADGIIAYQTQQYPNAKFLSFDKQARKIAYQCNIELENME